MLRSLLTTTFLFASGVFVCAAQTTGGAGQAAQTPPPTDSTAKADHSQEQATDKNSPKPSKKAKKVWTEDDVSKIGGGISVVGDSSPANASKWPSRAGGAKSDKPVQDREVQSYRERLRQLQAKLEDTDKKIEELRNFKGENTSPSGGINPHRGYYMTPIADQIKQLEEKKKQLQDQMDALTDEARKKGIEPGELR